MSDIDETKQPGGFYGNSVEIISLLIRETPVEERGALLREVSVNLRKHGQAGTASVIERAAGD